MGYGQVKQFANQQASWFFWTWKVDATDGRGEAAEPFWDLRECVRRGWLDPLWWGGEPVEITAEITAAEERALATSHDAEATRAEDSDGSDVATPPRKSRALSSAISKHARKRRVDLGRASAYHLRGQIRSTTSAYHLRNLRQQRVSLWHLDSKS